jgi:hypothetical protein
MTSFRPAGDRYEAEKMAMLVVAGTPGSLEQLVEASDMIERRRRAGLLPDSRLGAWLDYVIDMALNVVWRP